MFGKKKCFGQKMSSNNCIMEKSYSEFSALEKTEMFIELFKSKWSTWTIGLCGWSILFIFGVGIIAEITESGTFDIFRELSSWVGLILGIVATLFSIISMFLSFYNLEKERETKKENELVLKEVTDKLNSSLIDINTLINKNQRELLERIGVIEKKTDEVIYSSAVNHRNQTAKLYDSSETFNIELGDDK